MANPDSAPSPHAVPAVDFDECEAASPLGVPLFRNVWIATLISNFGSVIQNVGAAWLMASMVDSPTLIALVPASAALPITLLALPAGAIADGYDRRKLILGAQSFMLLVSLALTIATWLGHAGPWVLLAMTFLIGCGAAINNPAWQASVGDIVPRRLLSGAVGLNAMSFNLARSAGPGLGGAIVGIAGAAAAFFINAVSYIAVIVAIARWKRPPRTDPLPRERLAAAMGDGVRFVWLSPHIRLVLGRAMLFGLGAAAIPALMPILARDRFAGGPLTYGLLLGAFGLGAVGGAIAGTRLRSRLPVENVLRLAGSLAAIGAAVTAFSPWLALTLPALAAAGTGWVMSLSSFNVSAQLGAPRWVVARALSLYQMCAFAGLTVGSWLFGQVAAGWSTATALAAASAVLAVGLVVGWRFPVPAIAPGAAIPLRMWNQPVIGTPIDDRAGPITIMVEYRIRAEDEAAFLLAMAERRRIRRRDGAHKWRVLQGLEDPEIWYERYQVATWFDYVRHNQRRTQADAENTEVIRSLHAADEPPRILRLVERQPVAGTTPDARMLASGTI